MSPFLALAAYLALHLGVAMWSSAPNQLLYLDSTWYTHIAAYAYVPATELPDAPMSVFAFFPLWPLLLAALHAVVPVLPIQVEGAALATLLFCSTVFLIHARELGPKTALGFLAFLFSPGAWVFVTNHTESLFLLLSWSSLYVAMTGTGGKAVIIASMLAGLAALTRNQGIVLAVGVAVALASSPGRPHAALRAGSAAVGDLRTRLKTFITSGLISGALYALWPLFQWWKTGNPFISMSAQSNWHAANSLGDYLSNFFWLSTSQLPRRIIFFASLAAGIAFLRRSRSRGIGVYVLLSVLLWPIQGNSYAQAYRFSAVLFPVWFLFGDKASELIARFGRVPTVQKALTVGFVIGMVIWSATLSSYYFGQAKDLWPY